MKIFSKVIWKQSRSYEPNRDIEVGFIGVSAVKRKAVSRGYPFVLAERSE